MNTAKIVFLFFLAFYGNTYLFAASFDCTKSKSAVEILICSDNEVSQLDSDLAKLYSAKKTAEVTAQQKEWLATERNVCKTTACLKSVYIDRIAKFGKKDQCELDERRLLGSWVKEKGEGFEEMNFSLSSGVRSFTSWLHHRPEMTGTWNIDSCVIYVRHSSDEKLQFEYKFKKLQENKLFLFDLDTNSDSVYRSAAE
jgi:uncharacterized protein